MKPTHEISDPDWDQILDRDREIVRLREALRMIQDKAGTEAVENGQIVEYGLEWCAHLAKTTLATNPIK